MKDFFKKPWVIEFSKVYVLLHSLYMSTFALLSLILQRVLTHDRSCPMFADS